LVDKATLDLAMHNYYKSVDIAYKLGLDLNLIMNIKDGLSYIPGNISKPLFNKGNKYGLTWQLS